MRITSVEYKKSLTFLQDDIFVEKNPEIVFVGRSNVGKSSLLNALFGKKNMAYTSAMPGKTRTANVYMVNKKYFFTDLPGYGYARGGKERVKQMDELITWYILGKKTFISSVIMLVDSKIGPQKVDLDMYAFLKENDIPLIIGVTKVDKLTRNELHNSLKKVEQSFFGEKIIGLSAVKKDGTQDMLDSIEQMISLSK